jgi:DNA-binding winged helix-turn-helix (wHTH) protein
VLRAGPVTLDLQRRLVDVGGEPISLTGREFLLLRHLMMQPGEVCTRADLLSEVWGYSFDPGTNVVDVCVRRLRAKVGAERIETIRNVGYAFQASSPLNPGLGLSVLPEDDRKLNAVPNTNGNGHGPSNGNGPSEPWTEVAETVGKDARLTPKALEEGRKASYAMVAAAKASTPLSALYAVWLA